MPTLSKAIEIGPQAHQRQVDKASKPYLSHSLAVIGLVEGESEKVVAVPYNVVEDTPIALADLTHNKYLALHNGEMNCPDCQCTSIRKNGHRGAKQNYVCVDCGRQFIDFYSLKGYSDAVKDHCLKLYVNGLGFRATERCTGVNHNTVINWVKALGEALPNAPDSPEIPQIAQVDELETFVGSKKQNLAIDGSKCPLCWDSGLGIGETECANLLEIMVSYSPLAVFFIYN